MVLLKLLFLFLWQLPQNILGLLVIFFTKARVAAALNVWVANVWVANKWPPFGVSLGNYIIFGGSGGTVTSLKHERGHQKQSLYLGPLYLIIIGLPSIVGNLIWRVHHFNYYSQPWEAWADKLGGVKRG